MANNSWDALAAEATNMDTPPQRLAELARHKELAGLVAANPGTPPDVLKQLSTAKDTTIRRAVVQNPNTPFSTLYTLAAEFPQEFLRNAILPMLQITRPHFIKELPLSAWRSLLRFTHLPRPWLQQVERDRTFQRKQEEVWSLIQLHGISEIPTEWRQQAAQSIKKYVAGLERSTPPHAPEDVALFLLFVMLFPYVSPMLKEQWLHAVPAAPRLAGIALAANAAVGLKTITKLSLEQDTFILSQVGRYPLTSPKILARLAMHKRAEVRRAVAGNPHTPLESIYHLLSEDHAGIRRAAVSHPALAQQDYEILALDKDGGVRAALAALPRLSPALYSELAHDPALEVRAALARNAKVAQELLHMLARDPEVEVRAAAAGNPRLPGEMLEALVDDPAASVRASLSGNARITEHCVTRLIQDPVPVVRRYLAANPRTPAALLPQLEAAGEMEVWQGIARHPRAEPEQLERLARYGDWRVRAAIATNKQTPVYVLDMLAQEEERAIWLALVANPHTPLDILERAPQRDDLDLWFRMRSHPQLVQQQHYPFVRLLASKLQPLITANTLPNWVRRVVFQWSSALPAPLLEPFADSPYWEDRYLLARHFHSEQSLLNKLAQDGIVYVRAAANEALERRQRV